MQRMSVGRLKLERVPLLQPQDNSTTIAQENEGASPFSPKRSHSSLISYGTAPWVSFPPIPMPCSAQYRLWIQPRDTWGGGWVRP